MYKKGSLLLIILLFTNCSSYLEPTSVERKMDDKFEKALLGELNKIRRVKGVRPIALQQRDEKSHAIVNPFDAQMRRGY